MATKYKCVSWILFTIVNLFVQSILKGDGVKVSGLIFKMLVACKI